jgi:hypothetical protein
MREAAALWSVGYISAAELVDAACDLLVTGHDGLNLAMLAGVLHRHASEEAPDLLENALSDVNLPYHPKGSQSGAEAAIEVLANRVLTGRLTPTELTMWAHSTSGHGTLDLAERLVKLDDQYGAVDHEAQTQFEDLDAKVLTEARRIVGPRPPTRH